MVNSLVWQHVHVRQELEKDKVTTTKRICGNAPPPRPFFRGGFILSRPYK